MSTMQIQQTGTSKLARVSAAILFAIVIVMGYVFSPRVEGAVETPAAAEEQVIMEPEFLPSDCVLDGLVFADCNLDF